MGFDGIELISGDSRENVQESVYSRTMFGEIERRKSLDAADNGLGHVAGVQ